MTRGVSPSIQDPAYWWYRVRADLLHTVLGAYVGDKPRVLDIGSADGPSVGWLSASGDRVALDIDPRGLRPGDVCGSAMALPFADAVFDLVAAFDVIEHCEPERLALAEVTRVLAPGGRLLMSVPAYQWAWTRFDDQNSHHRRYTRQRAVTAVEAQGLEVLRASYIFAGTFPLFALDRLTTRLRERIGPPPDHDPDQGATLTRVRPVAEKVLMALARVDRWMLRRWDLPFGSSVVLVARKPSYPGTGPAS